MVISMKEMWQALGIAPADILLPREDVYLPAWAVVACDQFTSQPDYWEEAALQVGGQPSTLRLILPEVYLEDMANRLPGIYQAMGDYLRQGILETKVCEGFILTQRTTPAGERVGLIAAADLEAYDYRPGAQGMIRATEDTVPDRLPPRIAIRRGAALECPHVVCLMDDVMQSVIEPLYSQRESLPLLYDFPLMMGGGHLKGWAVTEPGLLAQTAQALAALKTRVPFLFAVGDGNHSLAAAKALWEEIKPTLSPAQRETHPARYALVEIENIHDDALCFEPIHRLLTGVQGGELMNDWTLYCHHRGMDLSETPVTDEADHTFQVIYGGGEITAAVTHPQAPLPVGTLQAFLDDYLLRHPQAAIDYIHGEGALRSLCQSPGTVGFLLPAMDKGQLFPTVIAQGALPRKTFSMGEAKEKRYYMECRKIKE